jgi:hypothetical protein
LSHCVSFPNSLCDLAEIVLTWTALLASTHKTAPAILCSEKPCLLQEAFVTAQYRT